MATIDELKKKDGSAVNVGAARPAKGLFPYNQPEVDIYKNVGAGNQPVAPKAPGPGLFPYNKPEANIYGGLGKPANAPENQPGARGILGNAPLPPSPLSNPNQIPAGRSAPLPANPAAVTASPNQIPTNGNPAAPAVPSVAPQATQPMDAQAQADRATAASMMGSLGDMNRRAGAAIADVATLIPRGLAGAYDTAVVRPMRAAGMNAGFLSPMLAPDGADPASQTPFYDKIRAQDAMAAAPKPAGAPVSENAVVRNAMAAGASANPAAPAQVNPNVAPSVAPGTPTAQAPGAMQAMAAPSGAVTRVGNSYSGTNVAGDISINGASPRGGMISAQNNQAAENLARRGGQTSGFGPPGAMRGGGQVSSIDTSAGYASDLRQLAEIDKTKAEQNANMQAQGAAAKQSADEYRRSARNLNDITSPEYEFLRRQQMAADSAPKGRGGKDARAAAAQMQSDFLADLQGGGRKSEQATAQDATTRRGQDITAANQTAAQKLADQRFGLDSAKAGQDATNAGIDNESKTMLLNAQKAFANAKTPEERQSAMAVLSGLSGKERTQQAQFAYSPGGQILIGDKTVTQPGVIFNQFTGQRLEQGAAKSIDADPRATAIKDDLNLTREQKVAELKKMGFQ